MLEKARGKLSAAEDWLAQEKYFDESGDYDVYSGIERSDAENAVREAREFVTEAERYLQPFLPQKAPGPA